MRIRRSGLTGRVLLSATAAAALSFAATVAVARAEPGDGISATGATIDKVGWWHEKNVATETPVTAVTVPPPPGVPAGTLAVGALNGEADRLLAIGILPEAVPGDTVTRFTLSIKEAGPPAINANSDAAKIVACPITSFWVGGENGTWATRPEFDCELAKAPGVRAADGTWTFDLLPIGQVWTDPAGTIAADGIVLVEDVESPEGFQSVFATEGAGALVVAFESQGGQPSGEPSIDPPVETPIDGGSFDPGSFDSGSFDSGSFDTGSTGDLSIPEIGSVDVPVGGLPSPAAVGPDVAAPPLATAPTSQAGPNVLGNLPGGVALAVPLFLGLLTLLSIALGPAGEPATATRQGGVSRALAARVHTRSTVPSLEKP